MTSKHPATSTGRLRSRKGAPGILDVALRAGVSGGDCIALLQYPRCGQAGYASTELKQAARDLGYIRDRVAGALHGKMSGSVGLIVPTIDHAIFSELIEAFSAELHAHDRNDADRQPQLRSGA